MMRFNSDLIESLILEKNTEAEPIADDLFSLLRDNRAFFLEIDNKLASAAWLQDVLSPQPFAQVSPQEINFFDGSESAAMLPFATAPLINLCKIRR